MSLLTKVQNERYSVLRTIVDRWAYLGSKIYAGGTICIGHVPHLAPEAYLHRLLPPLNDAGIESLQAQIGMAFPSDICSFLHLHNGIGLFDGLVGIYGLRTSYQRSNISGMIEQPFDMVSPNTHLRPSDIPDDLLLIGSLGENRDWVAMWPNGSVSVWVKQTAELSRPLYASVFEFLVEEAAKAESRFDQNGYDLGVPKLH